MYLQKEDPSKHLQKQEQIRDKTDSPSSTSALSNSWSHTWTNTLCLCQPCPPTTGAVCQKALFISPYPNVWLTNVQNKTRACHGNINVLLCRERSSSDADELQASRPSRLSHGESLSSRLKKSRCHQRRLCEKAPAIQIKKKNNRTLYVQKMWFLFSFMDNCSFMHVIISSF